VSRALDPEAVKAPRCPSPPDEHREAAVAASEHEFHVEAVGEFEPKATPEQVDETGATAETEQAAKQEQVADSEPPKFIRDTQDVLRTLWSWLLVGEEHRPKNVPMEYAVASTWLMRVGVVLLVFAVGFFLNVLHSWMAAAGKAALTTLVGAAMLVGGLRMMRGAYRILGHGVVGGGLAALYFSMYAAGPRYELVTTPVAFALMALVTACAGVLSVRFDSQITAILGMVGGFLTPVMLSTGEPHFGVLYTYLLLLSLGILGIAHVKQWRMLNYLGFVGTWALLLGSLEAYDAAQHFPLTITFFSLFFVLNSALVYYYNVLRRSPATLLEVIHLLLNVAIYASIAHMLIDEAAGRPWPAVMSVGVAAMYIGHIYLFLKRRQDDRRLLVVFFGLGAFFTVWTMPLLFEKATLTVAWALQALLLIWLGVKLRSTTLNLFGQCMYALVLFRVVAWDLQRGFATLDWRDAPIEEYARAFWTRLWSFGSVIVSLLLAHRVQSAAVRPLSSLTVPGADKDLGRSSWRVPLRVAAYWIGIVLAFVMLYLETHSLSSYVPLIQPMINTLVWAGFALFLFSRYRRNQAAPVLSAALVATGVTVARVVFLDGVTWDWDLDHFAYAGRPLGFLVRFADYAFVFILLIIGARWLNGEGREKALHRILGVAAIVLGFVYTTLEVSTFTRAYLPGFQAGAVSVLWAAFAVGFLLKGMRVDSKAYRFSGLTVFAVVASKVFLSDLSDMPAVYRVLGAMTVGILLLAGAFVYLRAAKTLQTREEVIE